MSKIQERIKNLQLQQKKIDFLVHIAKSAEDYENEAYAEVKEEVVGVLTQFVENAIKGIEHGTDVAESESLTPDDLKTLKALANRVKTKKPTAIPATKNQPFSQELEEPKQKPKSKSEQINFAMEHRHFGGKKVKAVYNNQTYSGQVVALEAPNIIIKTDDGEFIHVSPNDVEVL